MKRKFWVLGLLLLVLLFTAAAASAAGWTKDGDHLLYYGDDNVPVKGTQTIGGSLYYFTDEGYLKGNGSVQKT